MKKLIAVVAISLLFSSSLLAQGGCTAGFLAYPDSTNNYTVQFIDNSTGSYEYLLWEFGDGNTSTQTNPVHSYNAGGLFLVCLTIWDSLGTCQDTYCDSVFVSGNPGGGDCENSFTYTADDSLTYTFYGQINTADSTIFSWDFGDGTTGTGQTVTHTFLPGGVNSYYVCLSTISYDSTGGTCEDMSCQYVQVFPPSPGCSNLFSYTIDDSLTYTFEGDAYYNGNLSNNNAGFIWDFGDGNTGTGQTISHTFSQNGLYDVCLTTIHFDSIPDTCVAVSCQSILVGNDTITSYNVSGIVYLQNQIPADVGEVYLMTLDSMGANQGIVQTTFIDSSGMYTFTDVPMGSYYVQAELGPNSSYFGQYMPTYHLSALYWQNADLVVPDPVNLYDIYMIPNAAFAPGIGNIHGIVEEESFRELMEDVEMMLLGPDNEPYYYIRTDESGEYLFGELGFGKYTIYAEIMGIETIPVTVILDEANPTHEVNILVKDGMALGIDEGESRVIEELGSIYPNPVKDNVGFTISLRQQALLEVNVMNLVGQRIIHEEYNLSAGKQKIQLNTGGIPSGLYHLQIITSAGESISRKLIKY
jgi:PKD repeat protein